jgi:hypothetical protein
MGEPWRDSLTVQLDLLDHRTGTVPIDIRQQEATS